jgi:uncharacterized protein YkwD
MTRLLALVAVGALVWFGAQYGKDSYMAMLDANFSPVAAAKAGKTFKGNGLHKGWEQQPGQTTASTPTTTTTEPEKAVTIQPSVTPTPTSSRTPSPTPTLRTGSVTRGELAGADRCTGADDLTQPRTATLCLLNYARQYRGLGKVSVHDTLMASSLQKAKDVAACGYNHNPCDRANPLPSGVGCVGEVLFQGPKTPYETMKGWLASAGHRDILLDRDYRYFGFATVSDDGGRVWVVQMAGC